MSTLRCTEWHPIALKIDARCLSCGALEVIETARLSTLNYPLAIGGDSAPKVRDIPHLELIASRFTPGGGFASNDRFSTTLGLRSFSETKYNNFCNGPLLSATLDVFQETRNPKLSQIRGMSLSYAFASFSCLENCLANQPTLDGITRFFQIKVQVDTRWPNVNFVCAGGSRVFKQR
jgi:hypothetical protein